jgi:nicotinate-nucleotide pyrophosphorylase (carboxylating)
MDKLLEEIKQSVAISLSEDIGQADITSGAIVPENSSCFAKIISKESGIISGEKAVSYILDNFSSIKYAFLRHDADSINADDIILELDGNYLEILRLERVILNYLQHLSGVATLTNKYVQIANKYSVDILDTRKTLPGLRFQQKKAVLDGGGKNHRLGLYDAMLIKENHIKIAGGVSNVLEKIKHSDHYKKLKKESTFFLEIELETFEQLEEACNHQPNIIMLDNMSNEIIQKCIIYIRKNFPKIKIEISGGINEKTIEEKAKLRPDRISIGSITHSVQALDMTLLVE